jgi:hypothetical protein
MCPLSTTTSTVQLRYRDLSDFMAISHELSSEIADALFTGKERSPRELNDLKEIVFKIHSALQQLTDKARIARVARVDLHTPQSADLTDLRSKSAGKDS